MVELLVVLVIMGILASLGTLAYTRASAAAKSAECVAHLRQLFVAVEGFRQDNDGNFPSKQVTEMWHVRLAPYLGINLPDGEIPGAPPCARTPFYCPAVDADDAPKRSYALNSRIADNNLQTDDRFLTVTDPAATALIADGKNTSWLQSRANLSYRHDGGRHANVLYVDGHVEQNTLEQINELLHIRFILGW